MPDFAHPFAHPGWLLAACGAAGLIVTLVLAAFLTPRHWWRRANVRALTVLVAGTAAFGWLFLLGAGALMPRPVRSASAPVAALMPMPMPMPVSMARVPVIQHYRVFDDLNLRAASGTAAARIAIVPAGAVVATTGRRDGDWWEVSARVDGRTVTGWASSLWLRRADETGSARAPELPAR
ncbi:MAG: SH3 domain-containing protein [Pseudomonadota bacterium]|nr:SH3 domain-containing protein [Pseudomonadota bacterium]